MSEMRNDVVAIEEAKLRTMQKYLLWAASELGLRSSEIANIDRLLSDLANGRQIVVTYANPPQSSIAVGDVVHLASGGPEMTVRCRAQIRSVTEPEGVRWECDWFERSSRTSHVFHESQLKKVR